jgi:hypothetical protein
MPLAALALVALAPSFAACLVRVAAFFSAFARSRRRRSASSARWRW